MKKTKPRMKTHGIRLPDSLWKALEKKRSEKHATTSDVAREALWQYVGEALPKKRTA